MAKSGAKAGAAVVNIEKLNRGDYREWLKSAKRAHAGQRNMAFATDVKVSTETPRGRKFEWLIIDGKKVKRFLD